MDARSVKQAVDLFRVTNGRPASSIDELVSSRLLDQAPSADHGYEIAYDPTTEAVTAKGACNYP